jgi:transcription elongation GreA/GreB family factor
MTMSEKDLWGIIMHLANPSDLLQSVFNAAKEPRSEVEISADRSQMIVILNGTVTINQHMSRTALTDAVQPAKGDPSAASVSVRTEVGT